MIQDAEPSYTLPSSDAEDCHVPSECLLEQVRDALTHLYEYAYLQGHPLGEALGLTQGLDPREAMRALRTRLLETIEAMNPGTRISFRSQPARSYNVLNLHYVEGLTIQEVSKELALSERQIYRELRRAETDLATLLLCQRAEPPSRAELVHQEAERIGEEAAPMDLVELMQGALDAVERLAEARRVHLRVADQPDAGGRAPRRADPFCVHTYPMLARQALVSTLSHAIQQAPPASAVSLRMEGKGRRALVQVTYALPADAERAPQEAPCLPVDAQQLVRRLDGEWAVDTTPEGEARARVSFWLGERLKLTVLVVDDNEGLVELFRRYLSEDRYHLVPALDGCQGLSLARALRPDVVILDVMMPQQDGWEVLQLLQHHADTRGIPVIVCSVLNDPELAGSLGAAAFLSKPVSRDQLLAVLAPHRLGTRPPSPAAAPPDSASPPTG